MIYQGFFRRAAETVWAGGVIAYPTEAVFGLGCDPLNHQAVSRLLTIKQRPVSKGLIVIASSIQQLHPFMGDLSHAQEQRLNQSWPGPVTWLVPVNPQVPQWLTGNHPTLAMRVTRHPVAAKLCSACDTPLVSTSANVSTHEPTRTRIATQLRFGLKVDYIVPGRVGTRSKPSEIRDLDTNTVLRPG